MTPSSHDPSHPHSESHDHSHSHSHSHSRGQDDGHGSDDRGHRSPQPLDLQAGPPQQPQADASVRTGRSSDAPAVGMVQAAVWRESYAQVLSPEVLETFDAARFGSAWRRSLSEPPSPRHRLLVACAGDQVVGFAAIGPAEADEPGLPEGTGELLVLAVHPDARRVGHGSRLLNAAADTLRANDLHHLHTWVGSEDEQARAFSAAAGLEPDGAWRDRVISAEGDTTREVRVRADL